jgi:type II secretory pathway component PulF
MQMKKFLIVFAINYICFVILLMALNFVLPDFNDGFSVHITDVAAMTLTILSWGNLSSIGIFMVGFPASAAILAILYLVLQRLWNHRTDERLEIQSRARFR